MKIRTQEDVDVLDKKIKDQLGIDVRKYRNDDVVESFVALLVFPEYILTWVIRPVLIALVAFVAGFFILNLTTFEKIIYGPLGFGLFMSTGLLTGLLFLMARMRKDMWGIIDYSLGMMRAAVKDLEQVNSQIDESNRKDVMALLFKGIIHIVTIPVTSQVISERIPILGWFINPLVKKVLTIITDRVNFDEAYLNAELNRKIDEPKAIEMYTQSLSTTSIGLQKLMGVTFGLVRVPILIALVFFALTLAVFVYLIH